MRIPVVERQVGLEVAAVAPRGSVAEAMAPGLMVAEFGDRATRTIGEVSRRFQDAQRATDLMKMNADATKGLYDLTSKYQDDPDFKTAEARYQQDAAALKAQLMARTQDPAVQAAAGLEFDKLNLKQGLEIRQGARKKQIDYGRAMLDSVGEDLAHQYAASDNPADKEFIAGQYKAAVGNAFGTGQITAEDAVKKELQFASRAEGAEVRRRFLTDPNGVLKDLADGKKYARLDENTRAVLMGQAQTRADFMQRDAIRFQEKAERDADRRVKAQQDQNSFTLFERLTKGDLPEADINEGVRTRSISPEVGIALYKTVRDSDLQDNPAEKLDHTNRVLLATPDTQSQVHQDVLDSRLSVKTKGELLKLLRTTGTANDVTKGPEFAQGKAYLERVLKTTGPGASVLDPDEQRRTAQALQEYTQRMQDPQRTTSHWTIAEDIGSRFSVAPPTLSSLGTPRFMDSGVSRNDPAAFVSSLREAAVRTTDELAAGRITQAEATVNLKLIKDSMDTAQSLIRWNEAQQAAKKAKAGGKK